MEAAVTTAFSPFVKRWAGVSVIIGGLFWSLKGGLILITGIQPLYIFEISPLFLGLGLWGLYLCLDRDQRTGLAKAGVILAIASAVSAPIQLWANLFAPHLVPQEDTVTIITPFVVLAGMGVLLSTLLLGIVVWRSRAISQTWLPLAIPVGFVAFMVGFILLEGAMGETPLVERLLEFPIVVLGLAWIWLGFIIYNNTRA